MGSSFFKGTLVPSTIVRGSSGDTYGTHHSVLGVGGYMELKTLSERDAIPIDNTNGLYSDKISSGQRRIGMLVHVFELKTVYQLLPPYTYSQWNSLTDSAKLGQIANNNNWITFITYSGGTTPTENISKNIYQITHGFVLGDVIGYNGSQYVKVSSSTALTIEPLGMVSNIIDVNNFRITYSGYIDTTGIYTYNGGALLAGDLYYLSSTSGKITSVDPISLVDVSKPILATITVTSGIVLQYRGLTSSEQGVSYSVFNSYTGETQTFLDKMVTGATNLGYFSGYTGKQYLTINTAYSSYNGIYTSLYNYYYRDDTGKVRLGSPTYHGALRRGYVSNFTPKKSWIYNTYIGSGNQIGWILADGDITLNVGNYVTANSNSGTPPFTQSEWGLSGVTYYSTGGISISLTGSLYTGTTYNVNGPLYKEKENQELELRTIISKNTNTLQVTYDDNFIYLSGSTTGGVSGGGLSGATNLGSGIGVYESISGCTIQFNSLVGSGNTSISKQGNNIVVYSSADTTSTTYNLTSPSTCTVGGIIAGTVLTGKTAFQLFEEILAPELFGTLTGPGTTASISPSGIFEIGCTISSLSVCGTFSRGCINPQYCSLSQYRSGLPNAYNYSGHALSGTYACTNLSIVKAISNYVVSGGTQTWQISTNYDCGVQPKGSNNTDYCIPLLAGTTSTSSASICGILPWYWGLSTTKIINGACVANCGCGTTGCKCVANVTTSPIQIIFNSSPTDYIWFALPSCAATKTCWFVNGTNNGCIGGIGNLFATYCTLSITSAESCWAGCNYEIYVSCAPTGTAYNVPMCIY